MPTNFMALFNQQLEKSLMSNGAQRLLQLTTVPSRDLNFNCKEFLVHRIYP